MIIFNGFKFAKNDQEFAESLFSANGTAFGFYKKTHNGVKLYLQNHELFAFIKFEGNTAFIVSASECEGKTVFMFSTTTLTDKRLKIDGVAFGEVRKMCEDTMTQCKENN